MILNWNSEQQFLENFSKISVFIKIYSFQDRRLFKFFLSEFFVITWLNFDLEQQFSTKISLKDPSKSVPQTYIWKFQSFGRY